jgi:uncharacterized membrane protein YoaK (UPF0700 family)
VRRSRALLDLQKTPVALLLTAVAGYIDVFGYIFVYSIYVAHMSGNTVAAARHLAELNWYGFLRHLWPIATFVGGLIVGGILFEAQVRYKRLPIASTLLLEAILVAAFIAFASGVHFEAMVPPQPSNRYYLIVALLTVAMGVQNVTIRKIGGINVYTTFVTGSLVKFGEAAANFIFWFRRQTHGRLKSRLGIALRMTPRQSDFLHMMLTGSLFICYVIGAYCGAAAGIRYQLMAMFVPLAILVALAFYGVLRPFVQHLDDEW